MQVHNVHRRALVYIVGYFVLYTTVLGLSFSAWYHFEESDPHDSGSYMSHAFTIGLDGDLDYSNEFSALSDDGAMNEARTSPKHPIGPGLLAAPFVAAVSILDRLGDHPVLTNRLAYIGSWSYFGIQLATVLYFLFGIALYQFALRRWVSPFIVTVAVLSSGLLFYVTGRFSFGHVYEFFSLALLTWACIALCSPKTTSASRLALVSAVAIATFFIIMVRWVAYGLLGVPLIAVLTHYLLERAGRYRSALLLAYGGIATGICGVAIFYIATFKIPWPSPKYFYNKSFKETLGESTQNVFNYLADIPLVIFSSEFGILYTFPLLPIATLAAVFIWARNVRSEPIPWTGWAIGFAICVSVPLAAVLLWQSTASSYGYRYLLVAMPALLLSTAIFLNGRHIDETYGRSGEWTQGAIPLVLGLASFLAFVSLVAQFGFGKVPSFTLGPQTNVFGKDHFFSARGYLDGVFGGILDPGVWQIIYRESLFHYIAIPVLVVLEQPQLRTQLGVLLIVPLIGALFSAAAHAQHIRACVRTAGILVLTMALAWIAAMWVLFPSQGHRLMLVGAYGQETTQNRHFTWMRRDSSIEVVTKHDEGCVSIEMFTLAFDGAPSSVSIQLPSGDVSEKGLAGSTPRAPVVANVSVKNARAQARIVADSEFSPPGDTRSLAFGLLLPVKVTSQKCPSPSDEPTG